MYGFRNDDDGWFRAGTIEVTTTVLVTAVCAAAMICWAVVPDSIGYLAIGRTALTRGRVWTVVTWPFAQGVSLWSVIDVAFFFFFARMIEQTLGRSRFTRFLALLTAGITVAALAIDVDGFGGIRLLSMVTFVVVVAMHPNLRTFFNIPFWVLGAVFVAIDVLQLVAGRDWRSLWLMLIALAVGALLMRSFGLADEYAFIPRAPLPGWLTGDPYATANRRRAKADRASSRHPTTARPGRRRSSPAPVVPIRPEPSLDRAEQAEMDALLDKINERGLESLDPSDRRRLEELSERLRAR
ncbi:MAG: DUF6576 domain-containing protein [Microthrixaceae bacterium]